MVLVECAVVGWPVVAIGGKLASHIPSRSRHYTLLTTCCIVCIAYYTLHTTLHYTLPHSHIPSRSRHYTLDCMLHSVVHYVLTAHFVPSRRRHYILQTIHCTSCNEYYTEHCNTRHYIIHCLLLTSHCLPHCAHCILCCIKVFSFDVAHCTLKLRTTHTAAHCVNILACYYLATLCFVTKISKFWGRNEAFHCFSNKGVGD